MKQNRRLYGEFIVETSEYSGADILIIDRDISDEHLNFLKKEDVHGVRVMYTVKEGLHNLQHLVSISSLKEIGIFNPGVVDVSFIANCTNVEVLHLDCKAKGSINFQRLKNLREVFFVWNNAYSDFSECESLQKINIVGLPHVNLGCMNSLIRLRSCKISSSKISTLIGVEKLMHLQSIILIDNKKLVKIEAIRDLAELQNLEISKCKKIDDYTIIESMNGLEKLTIDDCGPVESISFLQKIGTLKSLVITGGTVIQDGQISFLKDNKNLQHLRFVWKKNYSLPQDELNNIVRQLLKNKE